VGTTRLIVVGVAATVLTLAAALFLRLPRSPHTGCCGFELRFLRPGRLPDDGHYRLLRRLHDRLRRRIRMWFGGWSHCSLDNTPPSDDVIPPLAQVHLLGRGTGPLSFGVPTSRRASPS